MHPAAVEESLRSRAERRTAWGIGLLAVAALLWCYAAWQMFVPYETTYGKIHCSGLATRDSEDLYVDHDTGTGVLTDHEKALRCAADRDLPSPVTALLLAVPLSTAGGVLYATGTVTTRLRRHADDLEHAGRD